MSGTRYASVCDPCKFCQNLYDDSDTSVGLYGYGCTAYDEGKDVYDDNGNMLRPCPGFRPKIVSDNLYEQLYNEDEAEFYKRSASKED